MSETKNSEKNELEIDLNMFLEYKDWGFLDILNMQRKRIADPIDFILFIKNVEILSQAIERIGNMQNAICMMRFLFMKVFGEMSEEREEENKSKDNEIKAKDDEIFRLKKEVEYFEKSVTNSKSFYEKLSEENIDLLSLVKLREDKIRALNESYSKLTRELEIVNENSRKEHEEMKKMGVVLNKTKEQINCYEEIIRTLENNPKEKEVISKLKADAKAKQEQLSIAFSEYKKAITHLDNSELRIKGSMEKIYNLERQLKEAENRPPNFYVLYQTLYQTAYVQRRICLNHYRHSTISVAPDPKFKQHSAPKQAPSEGERKKNFDDILNMYQGMEKGNTKNPEGKEKRSTFNSSPRTPEPLKGIETKKSTDEPSTFRGRRDMFEFYATKK